MAYEHAWGITSALIMSQHAKLLQLNSQPVISPRAGQPKRLPWTSPTVPFGSPRDGSFAI